MALAYVPPHVRVNENVDPSVAPLLATPASVAIVGRSLGHVTRTDRVNLTNTAGTPDEVALPGVPDGATITAILEVKGTFDSIVYQDADDYDFDLDEGWISRPAAGSEIPAGGRVDVTYTYVPENYYEPTRLFSYAEVQEIYGPAYDEDGNVVSRVSFGARVLFDNGASDVVIQALHRIDATDPDNPVKAGVDDTQAAAKANWEDTLEALRDIEDVNVVVPIIGQGDPSVGNAEVNDVHNAVVNHIAYMKDNDQWVVGVFGEDGTNEAADATRETLHTHIGTLKSIRPDVAQQLVFVSPAKFTRTSPRGVRKPIGGQYVAAAVAGAIAARPVSDTLTRQALNGIAEVTEARSKQQKNEDAQAGFLVVEQRGYSVQVRHAITTDDTSTATRELSVVRAKHRMIESIRDTLDRQVIGQVVADGAAPYVVQTAVIGVLEALRAAHDIVDYANVESRQLSYDPTHVEVRFSYRPAFPLNYVTVTFALDLTTGSIEQGNAG
jgi:hypothetical protein